MNRHLLLCVCLSCPTVAQHWTLRDEAPATLDHVWRDVGRARTVAVSAQPASVWSFTGGRWWPHEPAHLPGDVWLAGYDAARGEAVALCNTTNGVQTWVGDGPFWYERLGTNPPLLARAAVAFDAARGRVIAFGGTAPPHYTPTANTWAWDGQTWTALATATAPSPRSDAGFAFDPVRARLVLFGGRSATGALGDTWEWDGSQWAQMATGGPSPRATRLAFDPRAQRVTMLGTASAVGAPTGPLDCWQWNGTTWTTHPALPAPVTAGWHDGVDLFAVGHDARVWRATTNGWTAASPASPRLVRTAPAIAFDPVLGEPVLAAGTPGGDTWAWRGTWRQLAPAALGPGAVEDAAMAACAGGLALFGGRSPGAGPVDATWFWNGGTWARLQPAVRPPARSEHRMIAVGTQVLLHGGLGTAGPLDDLWSFDGATWTQHVAPNAPPARYGHGFAYDTGRNRAVVHGGFNIPLWMQETWEWDGAAWTSVFPTSVPWGVVTGLVTDPASGQVLAFQDGQQWGWDGSDWQSQAATHLNDRLAAQWLADPVLGRFFSYGHLGQWYVHSRTSALVEDYGPGCGSEPRQSLLGRPALGTTPQLRLEGAPQRLAFFVLGFANTYVPWTPACAQLVTADASRFALLDQHGCVDLPFPLPDRVDLRGLPIWSQAGTLDGGPLAGASLANTLTLWLGD
jgi:hypothetical protein